MATSFIEAVESQGDSPRGPAALLPGLPRLVTVVSATTAAIPHSRSSAPRTARMIAVASGAPKCAGDAAAFNARVLASVDIVRRERHFAGWWACFPRTRRSPRRPRRRGVRKEHREERKTRALHARLAFGRGDADLQAVTPLPPHAFPSRPQYVRRFAAMRRGQSSFMSHCAASRSW